MSLVSEVSIGDACDGALFFCPQLSEWLELTDVEDPLCPACHCSLQERLPQSLPGCCSLTLRPGLLLYAAPCSKDEALGLPWDGQVNRTAVEKGCGGTALGSCITTPFLVCVSHSPISQVLDNFQQRRHLPVTLLGS